MSNLAVNNDNLSAQSLYTTFEYKQFCEYLEEVCGITLDENKAYLIDSRLKAIREKYGFANLSEIVRSLQTGQHKHLKAHVIDAMATNETSWFRDVYPYDILKSDILPELKQTSGIPRIWSAACSCGHEPYSISMSLQEYLDKNPGQFTTGVEIVATDISKTALAQAQSGDYDELALARGLSPERRDKFFLSSARGMRIVDKIQKRIRFQEFNLLQNYALLGQFDVVFCRNVLIYFSQENKVTILDKIASVLKPNGYLFLGASEPVVNHDRHFTMHTDRGGVYYRKKS